MRASFSPGSPPRYPRRTRAAGYTLIEILVAMGILSLAIAAASRLSLSQNMAEEVNQRRSMAVNRAECAARLWQLGINDPSTILLKGIDADGAAMGAITITTGTQSGGADYGINTVSAESATISAPWKHLLSSGETVTSTISLPALRLPLERR